MTTYRHTANAAFALNIVVFDDRGQPVDQFIFPFALFFFSLPGWLYGWLRSVIPLITYLAGLILSLPAALLPGGWHEDLELMGQALRALFQPRLEFAL
jgi:hypothetical protein